MKRIEELTTPARLRSVTSLWLEGYAREQSSFLSTHSSRRAHLGASATAISGMG